VIVFRVRPDPDPGHGAFFEEAKRPPTAADSDRIKRLKIADTLELKPRVLWIRLPETIRFPGAVLDLVW
jgi:hypothetical protein